MGLIVLQSGGRINCIPANLLLDACKPGSIMGYSMSRGELGRRAWVIACGLLLAAGQALAAAPASAPATLPVPDAQSARAAMLQVQELRALRKLDARGLLQLSLDTTSSVALRHAAALHAMEVAGDAGQAGVALEAIRELVTRFGESEVRLGMNLTQRLAKAKQNERAAVLACRYMDMALMAGQRGMAEELVSVLYTVRPAVPQATAALCADAVDDYQYATQLAPGGAMYACLYANQWETHLAALAAGGGELAEAAKSDLAAADVPARLQAAEMWWRAGTSAGGHRGWRIGRRACAIYSAALPRVDGVQKALISARLAEHQRQGMVYAGMVPGVVREIWKDGTVQRHRQQVSSLALPKDAKLAALPRTQAHVRFVGDLLIEQPGRYELVFVAGSGLRVNVDGVAVLDNPKAYSKRNGEKVVLELSAGLHPFDIEVWSASSQPRLEVRWIAPGSRQEQALPDSMLYHDPLRD